MKDEKKTKAELIKELTDLRRRFAELEKSETERKRMEELLRASEARLKAQYQGSPTSTLTWQKKGYDFELVDYNNAAKVVSKGEVLKFLGKTANEMYQDRPEILQDIHRCFTENEVIKKEVRSQHFMPGRTAVVTYTFVPPDLIMVHTEDITERKQAEEALREGEHRFRELYDNAPVGYHEFNNEGIITRVNRTELDMVGYTLEEVIGRPVWKFIMEEEVSHQSVLAKLAGDLPLSKGFERTYRRKDGSTFPVLIEDRLLKNEKGQVVGIRSTIQDITERKRMEEQLHIMSIVDELTGLYNRRGFFTLSQQQLKIAERTKKGILLFFADLDNMKRINDTLGHHAGDRALFEIAAILKEIFRESDIIGRIGGDEFAILAIDATDETREVLMERLHKSLEANNRLEAKNYTLSLCIGIARYDHTKPSSLDELMAQADTLMYEEKRRKQYKS